MSDQAARLKRVEDVLDALGDRTRREIVTRLRSGPLPVGELAAALPVGRPAVSKHLRVLESAGLVKHHSVGTRNLYALAPNGLVVLQQWLVQTWDVTLGAFSDRVVEVENEYGHRPGAESQTGQEEGPAASAEESEPPG